MTNDTENVKNIIFLVKSMFKYFPKEVMIIAD